jgi:DNA recombination protein RmuC
MELYIIAFLAGVLLTAFIAWLLHRSAANSLMGVSNEKIQQHTTAVNQLAQEKKELETKLDALVQRVHKAESQNELLQQHYQAYIQLQEQHQSGLTQVANLTAQLKYNREKLDNQHNDMLRMREQFRLEFSELSQKILEDQSTRFTLQNEQKLQQILEPLKTNLNAFKQKVEETYDKESKERFSLGKEVQRLIEMSQVVSQEANNLTSALKGSNKMQGNWGEIILESLLENSGLTKGREYMVQEFIKDAAGNVIKDENGKGLQPDVMIYYPDQRRVIIDSKVSLVSWEQCVSCDDKMQQEIHLRNHIRSLRQHVENLSRKNYPKYALALDYVLLFIPIEPAFLEAVKTDLQLWKYAYDKKILLVSPTNLFSVLKIIADLWKVEQQNKNAIEIAEKAGALYDKFHGFMENMELVGKRISDAHDTYNDALKQLSTGRGNMLSRMEELRKMGAKANKQLPERLLLTDE